MFKIHVNDGTSPIPDDDICYIVAKEGIFLKKKMGIMESIAPVQNISILESVEKMARMNIKKIPGGQFARVVAFFREVYKEYYGESIVLLFYDETKRVYKIVPPHQKVTGAACDYNKAITIEGMTMVGTIHSHASMSAFHSGTDDKDEEHFDGLHITVGNVNNDEVSITASIVANGHRFVVEPEDYVERLVKTKDIDEVEQRPTRRVYRWINGKMEEVKEATNQFSYSYRRYDKRYVVNVSEKYHKVIPEWMGMVEKGTYQYQYNTYGYNYGYGVYGQHRSQSPGWGQNFDASLWNQAGRYTAPARTTPTQKQLPLPGMDNRAASPFNVGVKVKPIEFPKHDVVFDGADDEFFPCKTCVFRGHKFLAEQAEDDFDETEVYKCDKCKQIVVDNTDALMLPVCPNCKTDEYLSLVNEDELPNHYTKEDDSPLKPEDGYRPPSAFITCPSCGNSFHRFADEKQCPFCYSLIDSPPDEVRGGSACYSQEVQLIEQSRNDSGEYLSAETEEINRVALQEAIKADQTIERIPEPNGASKPIPEPPSAQKREDTLFAMFKRVFGKEN
jgi:Cu/Ag efflux protein CusF